LFRDGALRDRTAFDERPTASSLIGVRSTR
jgi:hypothetical protein